MYITEIISIIYTCSDKYLLHLNYAYTCRLKLRDSVLYLHKSTFYSLLVISMLTSVEFVLATLLIASIIALYVQLGVRSILLTENLKIEFSTFSFLVV